MRSHLTHSFILVCIVAASCSKLSAPSTPPRTVSLAVSNSHSCAVLSDGTAWCWGANAMGQLGDGTTVEQLTPVRTGTIDDAIDVAVGEETTCLLRRAGSVVCVGKGGNAQRALSAVPGLSNDIAKIAGFADCTCAIRRTGQLVCWALGEAPTSIMSDFPGIRDFAGTSAVANASGVVAHPGEWSSERYADDIRERQTHDVVESECFRSANGSVGCRGFVGPSGAGPDGGVIPGVANAQALGLLSVHGCATDRSGQVSCWGGWEHEPARPLVGANDIVALAEQTGGQYTLCGIRRNGHVACWADAARTLAPMVSHLGVATSAQEPEMHVVDVVLPPRSR